MGGPRSDGVRRQSWIEDADLRPASDPEEGAEFDGLDLGEAGGDEGEASEEEE